MIAEAVRASRTTEYAATTLMDALIISGARCPCRTGEFVTWSKANGML